MSQPEAAETLEPSIAMPRQIPSVVWLALFLVLSIWAANRIGAFDFWTTVHLPDGRDVRLASVYGTVDHPFHATRAELLRRALADGHLLRWIGSHQGGYPVEFYPLGFAGIEVAIWAVLAGALPMALVHKLAVVLIFLAPGLAFALAARRDRLPLGVGLVALAAHLCVRGWWWSGGYQELVEWGLVTNVAAAVTALFALVFLTSYLADGRGRDAALTALCGGFCLYSNPRSGVALAVAGVGATISVGISIGVDAAALKRLAIRLGSVAVAVALIAAPQIASLIRFERLYYFVRYERYEGISSYWDSSIQAVSGPVFVVGVIGLVTALALPGKAVTRAAAITLVLYCLTTGLLSSGFTLGGAGEQLETTRLMPFQRLLTIFVAAVAVYDLAGWLAATWRKWGQFAAESILVGVAAAFPLLYVISPPSWIPVGDRGLVSVPTATTIGIADLRQAVEAADADAAPGTAILVLGSTLSWHGQLWSPLWSERPFFYDDWLWYWQTRHAGPYDPQIERAYDPATMAEVLERTFLQGHGIGAVVVTRTARTAQAAEAVQSALGLELMRAGTYDVYLVREPSTIVTFEGTNVDASAIDDHGVVAEGTSAGGTATIRRNWFPRWRAWVNGEQVAIEETGDGYMSVPIPAGQVKIELRYVVDGWDWLARAMCGAGILFAAFLAAPRFFTPKGRLARR